MGTLQHLVGNMPSDAKRGKQRIESNRYKRWQTIKYVVLIAGLVAAFFGSMVIGTLDPFSLLVRSIGLALLPAFNFAARALLVPMEHSHVAAIRTTGESLHTILQTTVLDFRQAHFAQGLALGILFLVILWASMRVTRFWCRVLCPLGAFLGVFSRFALFGMRRTTRSAPTATCASSTARAPTARRAGSSGAGRVPHVHELRERLPRGSHQVHASSASEHEVPSPDTERRTRARRPWARGAVRSAARAPTRWTCQLAATTAHPAAGRRRGARVPRALHPLRRVHEGVPQQRAAPGVLRGRTSRASGRPSSSRASATARTRACSRRCARRAPSRRSPRRRRDGSGRRRQTKPTVRLGTAFYDHGRCLPWAMQTPCIVCEELCPVSPKAIHVEEAQVIDSAGRTKTVKQPRVDPSRCVGCGACEFACPLQERPAVYVTSIGESRSPGSQILLNRS